MRFVLFWAAVVGWTMALIAHVCSLADIDVQEKIPYIWGLHIGVFLIWIPMVYVLKNSGGVNPFQASEVRRSGNPIRFFKTLAEGTPSWIVGIAVVGLVYAFANFFVFFFAQGGTPAVRDGQYYLHSHGQWIRNITEKEYHHYKAATIRGFSGHWIAFYGIAVAMLYPYKRELASPALDRA